MKKVIMDAMMRMTPECHPNDPVIVLYETKRGGDSIVIKCAACYRQFFIVQLPKERE